MSDEFLSLREAAARVGRAPGTLRRYIKSGRIQAQKRRGKFGMEYLIRPEDLPPQMRETRQPQIEGPRGAIEMPDGLSLEDVETIYIRRTMEQVGGNVSKAARRLGIGRSTLWRKLKRLENQ